MVDQEVLMDILMEAPQDIEEEEFSAAAMSSEETQLDSLKMNKESPLKDWN